jgi:hypothetical protein
MENTNLTCPCKPQCPNFGKCRECIAAHAQYYTVPHCIKTMQEEIKKNHLHPINPHRKTTFAERVAEYYADHPDSHLRTVAEELKITDWQLLDAMPTAVSVPVADFGAIYDALTELPEVMLHLDTGSAAIYKWGAPTSYLLGSRSVEKLGCAGPPPGLSLTDSQETRHTLTLRRQERLLLVSDGIGQEAGYQCCLKGLGLSTKELAAQILTCAQLGDQDDATIVSVTLEAK